MRYLSVILSFLMLAGCATLSEDQCRAENWEAVGYRDGTEGRREDFILQHAKACNKYGIRPNKTTWMKGRAKGLPLYCTPSKAFEVGRRGLQLSPVCPTSQKAALERAYQRGWRLHEIESEIAEIESDIRGIDNLIFALPPGDPERLSLLSERSFLRLDLISLRAERARYL